MWETPWETHFLDNLGEHLWAHSGGTAIGDPVGGLSLGKKSGNPLRGTPNGDTPWGTTLGNNPVTTPEITLCEGPPGGARLADQRCGPQLPTPCGTALVDSISLTTIGGYKLGKTHRGETLGTLLDRPPIGDPMGEHPGGPTMWHPAWG